MINSRAASTNILALDLWGDSRAERVEALRFAKISTKFSMSLFSVSLAERLGVGMKHLLGG